MPSSAVISWMRRSRSTSSCEYRRVPLGERLRLDQPARLVHAQRLRVHVGQLGGHRDHEHAAVAVDLDASSGSRRPPDGHLAALSARAARREQLRARIAVHHLRQLVDRLLLLLADSDARHVDQEAVVDVAAALAVRAAAGPRRAGAGPCRAWCPAGTRSFFEPYSVGTSTVGAADRLGDRDRDLDLDVLALALEHRRVGHAGDHVEVAGRPAARPGSPLPASRTRLPSRTPGGIVTRYRLTVCVAPDPRQVGQGSSMTVPLPPQCEQGWEIENRPWLSASTPRPWHPGQISAVVPGLAPVPWQVGHGADVGTASGTCAPSIDCSKVMPTSVSRSRPGWPRWRAPPRPPPGRRAPAAAAEQVGQDVAEPAGERAGVEAAEAGAAGRERTGAAVVLLALLGVAEDVVGLGVSLKRSSASLSPLLRSGWYCRASLR